MREIKFRAWDEEAEFMFYSDKPVDDYFFEFHKGKLMGYAIRPPRSSHDPMEPPEPYCDDYPVEQFTGLHDKNGKDLDWWEGDLLKEGETVKQIIYEDGCFWLVWPKHPSRKVTKVGNIHDNPLEQDNG
jgi:hypothetical protein